MSERLRSASTTGYHCPKMENDLSPRKTMLVIVIVVGCFAVLWPKVFYPMLVGSANQHIKPSPIDKTTGCCDVISETDVNTIKIMSELCGTIINATEEKPLTGKEIVQRCRQEVLETCGIDISSVLQEQVRLGQSVKQILDEVRSLNGSLCLKYNYGVAPWRLGVPHRVTVKMASEYSNIRQERPLHLRSELIHPAFRERGRAIPQPQIPPPVRPPPRVVEGRPGPVPGMRPTIGGAGHVVPPSKQGTSSMSVIMPIYTIGIVIFFTYTLMKIIFKKQPESVGGALYPPVDPDPHFRKEVFESEASRLGPRLTRENISSKLVVNAMSALLDEVDQEIEARRKSSEVASQDLVNGNLSNGDAVKPHDEEQPTVKVLGMEMTASCEGGKKWSRPESPVLPTSPPPPAEPAPPPQEIYLEGALPAQSHLLVSESATEREPTTGEDPAVVLSGKMTLSVISLDSENGIEEAAEDTILKQDDAPVIEEIEEPASLIEGTEVNEQDPVIKEIEEDIQKLVAALPQEPVIISTEDVLKEIEETKDWQNIEFEVGEETEKPVTELEKDIEDFLQKLREQSDIQAPSITVESEDVPHTVEVEKLEKEVDDLIQEAIDSIQQREPSIEIPQVLSTTTNEINDNSGLIEKEKIQVTEQIPQTTQNQTNLQVLNDLLDTEKEASPKFELRDIISNEIENLIREVKEMPNIEERLEKNYPKLGNEVDTNIEKDEKSAKGAELKISEKQIIEDIVQPSQIEIEEKTKPAEDTSLVSSKPEEIIKPIKVESQEKPKPDNEVKVEPSISETKEKIDTIKIEDTVLAKKPESEEKPKPDNTVNVEPTISETREQLETIKIEDTVLAKKPESEGKPKSDNEVKVEPTISEKREEIETIKIEDTALAKKPESEEETVEVKDTPKSEILKPTKVDSDGKPKPDSEVKVEPTISEKREETETIKVKKPENDETVEVKDTPKLDDKGVTPSSKEENKSRSSDDDELGSDEELEDEIEEIVYEEESEEEEIEIEVEEEESEENLPDDRNMNRTESSSVQRVNGERSEDLVEESKYTSVSGATAAENDISDEELTDEEVEEEEEIIEIEEEEIDDDDYIVEEGNDVNHISGESDPEL